MRVSPLLLAAVFTVIAPMVHAELPAPPSADAMGDWSNPFTPHAPGLLAADALLDKPAGGRGPIVVRDGHFFSGETRVRFWGMNVAFGANFPTHEQADAVAHRLARFGINAVRLHHMDNQPFPNGIFADASLTTLSPEALDRLDYFTAQLAKNGIWSDLNLHVSRGYQRYHGGTSNTDLSKIVDLFDPELIESQKRYARDLLTHVNAYTHHAYATEPAVAIVEINNENSLFMWDARQKLAALPKPYDAELKRQWNAWLGKKYGARAAVDKAWGGGEPLGNQILRDPGFATVGGGSPWYGEADGGFKRVLGHDGTTAVIDVQAVDGTNWHGQLTQSGLTLKKGHAYTVSFVASADRPVKMGVTLGQAHEPWQSLGLQTEVELSTAPKTYSFTVEGSHDDAQSRLSFTIGYSRAKIKLSQPLLAAGGLIGLEAAEDPAAGTVALRGVRGSHATSADWFTFLRDTESHYYAGMFDYLHHDLGVRCPVTGTIAFGLQPLEAQLGMDFIDAHAYWDHPNFPHKSWDISDWVIRNKPMSDSPQHNALFNLGGFRVAGKPFTVTEYNHAAPNEWEAECVPMIASYAAAQDWDGVFLFAYSHSAEFDKPIMQDFFNVEGNPMKMPLLPMGARLFLGMGVGALPMSMAKPVKFDPADGEVHSVATLDSLKYQQSVTYTSATFREVNSVEPRLVWTAAGDGTGRYTLADSHACAFTGFSTGAMPIHLGVMTIESMSAPFASLMLLPVDGRTPINHADRLLLSTVARATNTGIDWNADRTSVENHWGHTPEKIERVVAVVRLQGQWKTCRALDPVGEPVGPNLAEMSGDSTTFRLGQTTAQVYAISR